MRKLLITIIMLQTATLIQAQITKGDVQLNGTFSFVSIRNGTNTDNFRLNSNAGLFLSETTSLGLTLDYRNFGSQTNNVQFGVYSRMHKKLSDDFYLFLQPAFLILTGQTSDVDVSGFVLSMRPGMTYFMTPKWAIDLTVGNLGYSSVTTGNVNEVKTNIFEAAFNITSINLGLAFYFKSKN